MKRSINVITYFVKPLIAIMMGITLNLVGIKLKLDNHLIVFFLYMTMTVAITGIIYGLIVYYGSSSKFMIQIFKILEFSMISLMMVLAVCSRLDALEALAGTALITILSLLIRIVEGYQISFGSFIKKVILVLSQNIMFLFLKQP